MNRHGPIYLFSRRRTGLRMIRTRLTVATRIYLFLDYDGTLTPIRQRPDEAELSSSAKDLLVRITAVPGIEPFIVTGRSMNSIRRFIPRTTLTIAANHGFHIRYAHGDEWIHTNAIATVRTMTTIHSRLRNALRSFPDVLVENKRLTLSVHYRRCTSMEISAIRRIVTDRVASIDQTLRITNGKKVLEVRPRIMWGKNDAIMKLLHDSRRTKRPLAIFIGDDTTDEDAFRSLRPSGITVHVGKSTRTAAEYYVREVSDVHRFLKMILNVRSH